HAHARSHRHLDPATRLCALTREYQRIWGDEPLPPHQASLRRELQAKRQPYDIGPRAAPPPADELFDLRRRLTLAGYHRALTRMPQYDAPRQKRETLFSLTVLSHPQTLLARSTRDRDPRYDLCSPAGRQAASAVYDGTRHGPADERRQTRWCLTPS